MCYMFLSIKRNIFQSMLYIPALWYFDMHCGILTYQLYVPRIFDTLKFVNKYPMFSIAAIFVKYCTTTVSWLLWCMSYFMLLRLLTAREKSLWNGTNGPLRTNLSEFFIKIRKCSFTKMHVKILSGKWKARKYIAPTRSQIMLIWIDDT